MEMDFDQIEGVSETSSAGSSEPTEIPPSHAFFFCGHNEDNLRVLKGFWVDRGSEMRELGRLGNKRGAKKV